MTSSIASKHDGLLLALNNAVDAIIAIDINGQILSFNRSAVRLFGYSANAVIGRNVKQLMPEPHRTYHDDYIQRFLEVGERKVIGIGREVECLRFDGTLFPAQLSVSESGRGNDRVFIGFIRDLTERWAKDAELQSKRERITHAARLSTLGEIVVGLAHELSQPLAAISAYAEAGKRLLAMDGDHSADLRRACERIANQTERAGDVLSNIRALTERDGAGKGSIDLNALITDVVALIETDARRADMHLTTQLADVPNVFGDLAQIEQVIFNLVHNAIDEVCDLEEPRREVLIATGVDVGGAVRVSVTDRGHGVDEELVERIFDTFFTTKQTGMGMGLAISKSIVTAHEGKIGIRNNPEGGASFWITLPIVNSLEES